MHTMNTIDTNGLWVKKLISYCGEDPSREGLLETPKRVIEAYSFLTSGYAHSPEAVLKTFDIPCNDEMVFQSNIPFYSLCEHHILPFFGVAHIGYIPYKKHVGLSKLSRLVDIFARRLQTQENLCAQIANSLDDILDTVGTGVVLQARHMCMEARGVQRMGTVTTTSALRGGIKESTQARTEFLTFVSGYQWKG